MRPPLPATLVLLLATAVQAWSPSLQVRTSGSAAGTPVVLLGGGLLGADGWGRVPNALSKNHRVLNTQSLAVQYGLEDRALPQDYSLSSEVEGLKGALDDAQVDIADLIGMSHGGVTALVFATRYPRRVRTLTVIEPPAFWVLPNHGRDDPGARDMQAFVGSLRNRTIAEADVERFRCLLGECANGRSPRQSPAWNTWVSHRNALRGLHTIGDYDDNPEHLRTVRIPTLVVTGADTVPFHRAINASLARLLPRSTALSLSGGHNSPTADPDYFVGEWEKFVWTQTAIAPH